MFIRVFIKRLLWFIMLLLVIIVILPQVIILSSTSKKVFSLEEMPEAPIAIVFGASVRGDVPSAILYDRVQAASELYLLGKVENLLMTGDNSKEHYDEVGVMQQTAIEFGVAENDIVLDNAGLSTYASCQRAREVFGVENAILVTQSFHLPRALYLCEKMGIEVAGLSADRREYQKQTFNQFRDFFARVQGFWQVQVNKF